MRLKLSIARFEVSVPELKLAGEGFAQNRIKALESVVEDGRRVIADFLNQAMHAEMTLFRKKRSFCPSCCAKIQAEAALISQRTFSLLHLTGSL